MKDFYTSAAEEFAGTDRSFTFAGVEFKVKPLMPADVSGDIAQIQEERLEDNFYDTMVSIVRRCLKPEYRARWDALLAEEREVPITMDMIDNLVAHLIREEREFVEARTGRPTQPPSPSGSSANNASTSSTDASEAAAAETSTHSPSVPV